MVRWWVVGCWLVVGEMLGVEYQSFGCDRRVLWAPRGFFLKASYS